MSVEQPPQSGMRSRLQALVKHGETMIEFADAGQWETVLAMDGERRARLEAIFSGADDLELSRFDRQFRQLVELDRRLVELTKTARDKSAKRITQMQEQKRRRLAYNQTGAVSMLTSL